MGPVAVTDLIARNAVLAALEAAEKRFTKREETARATGNNVEADGAHRYALWCHRAYEAERKNPQPREW